VPVSWASPCLDVTGAQPGTVLVMTTEPALHLGFIPDPPSAPVVVDQATLDGVADALTLLRGILPLNSRDFGADPLDALLYGLFVGWACEGGDHPGEAHDDICGGDSAFDIIAARYRWTPVQQERVRHARHAIAALVGAGAHPSAT
jgi:hypothetical protein